MQVTLTTDLQARTVVVVFGPPLPGRNALARTLAHRLPGRRLFAGHDRFPERDIAACLKRGALAVVEGDFATSAERAAARRAIAVAGGRPLFVAWLCHPEEARREIYHRYAGLPAGFADGWWEEWQRDFRRRQPLGDEIPTRELQVVGARGSQLDHVIRIAARLGLSGPLPHAEPAPKRVLVVDDDEDCRRVLAETLEALGCEVSQADSAEAALAIAQEEPLDLVVTDQQMPGRSGTELAAELHKSRPEIRVAILTGYAEQTVKQALSEDGVRLLLAKPVAGADLVRLLDELA
jgi:CheY-like chemotaxis protein/predicted kinase